MDLYSLTTFKCSKLITEHYSTSFTLGIKTLHKKLHYPIFAIYGYVRYADEIVDTFYDHDQAGMLTRYREDTIRALKDRISTNPVLHCFQEVVHKYDIEFELIEAFLDSMEMDLHKTQYSNSQYEKYIYGSAEVVGLMCLRVFCEGDTELFERLKEPARKLGAAFQKVNFLRDVQSDFEERGRVYFPGVDFTQFSLEEKCRIEEDIQNDFNQAFEGILNLPKEARWGVYLAYNYYLNLFKKIKRCNASQILSERIRIPNQRKFALLVQTYFRHQFNFM
ncbi:phytoene/squalene synthase family protein [Roseivirga sp. BDSF3-8]|uniref:phytoene/squalene synthase family protein n=1 Tax=Roseivirga sp. BDSF3-8 TaxID=3241598 RepID=UPI003531D621